MAYFTHGFGSTADLDSLDREALMALLIAHRAELASQQTELVQRQTELASREAELVALAIELESSKQELVEQGRELLSSTEYIEQLKLQVEKLRRMLFGAKSEKVAVKLEQLELHLEEVEAARAELETAIEATAPQPEVLKSTRKPLPEHLPREVVTHLPQGECCTECGGKLRGSSAKMSPSNWSTSRRASRSFVMCGRSSHARSATAWWKRRRQAAPSSVDLLAQPCWRTCSSLNMGIIFRSIDSRRSTPARVLRSAARRCGRLGGRGNRSTHALAQCARKARCRRQQAACRRYADSSTLARQRQDEDWAAVDVCAR